ncbi:acyl-CoA thioesterase [Vaginella massiliensis]|uniref:acyl-CoA thioesterase n=1 Tax=Vaginella massiliensis TaxID=1816680 RepID=UPI00083857E7|nr:acyl-CoA thioesterase II [Vaginella massiliensis]
MKTTDELIDLLSLTEREENIYIGHSNFMGSRNVFGGQVVAQALNAAYNTVPKDRFCHSLHSYFILTGDLNKEIEYHVARLRDGGSFTTRYISAKQDDKIIFVMAASFQLLQEGYEHQIEMPQLKQPEELMSWSEIFNQFGSFLPKKLFDFIGAERPIEFKPVELDNPFEKVDHPPVMNVWVKFKELKQDYSLQDLQELIAYVSDYNLLGTALKPHASQAHFGNTQMASLDHSIWFHRKPDLSDWILVSMDSPSASGARGYTRGNLFNRNGELIASITQEGLIRPLE